MEIAILGGSFNPPHVGHQMACLYVAQTRSVDQVWMMPTYRHAFGKSLAPFDLRVRLCERTLAPLGPGFRVSRVEQGLPTPNRTVETLAYLHETYPEDHFSLIIGSDLLRELPSWKDADRLRALADFIVLARGGYEADLYHSVVLPEISSTEVRRRLADGETVDHLVPRGVLSLIREYGLYQS